MKRLFDLLVAGALLLISLPLVGLIALVMVCQDPGPVFYRQQRVGQAGKLFGMWKFRSMVVGADQQGPYFTAAEDRRITRVGRWLRRSSLDELPQLLNVLVGQMSLVGPRPDVPAQQANYSAEEWQKRCQVRPGITGLAQATLRSQATAEQRKAADLAYVDSVSLWGDIKILGLTFRQVVLTGGN